jgi:HAD superfamily hydrolase (TIGR01662 family)
MKVIIFDLWNTIAYHNYKSGSLSSICKKCYKNDYRTFLKSYETFFQTSKNISFEKSFEKLFKKLKIKYDDKKIKKYSQKRKKYETDFIFYAYLFPLLKKLKKQGYKIALLSNTSSLVGEKIKKTKLNKYFDKFFFSYELRSIKPDPKNFKTVLKHFKVKPSEALMIGDTFQDDVVASRKLGLKAIHFKNGNQILKELRKGGII